MSLVQHYTTGTSYIVILVVDIAGLTSQLLPQSTLLLLTQRQIASTARSTMHLQSQLNNVASLKLVQIISQLLSINMLIESRSMICANLLTRATMPYSSSLALRDILLTDFNAIQHSDSVAFLQVRHSGKISQRGQGQEQTIRLFTTQLHSLDIALFRIQITTARITIFILATYQIIYLTELFRQLTINREINAQLAFRVVQRNNYSIAKAISQLQTVCVGVLTNILQTSNISTVSHITFSLFIY